MKFYRVWFDQDDEEEWCLSNSWQRGGKPIDVWSYVTCRPAQRDPTPILKIRRAGVRTNFELAGPEHVPVAAPHIVDLVHELAPGDFERISAVVEDSTLMDIINVLACVDAINYEKSVLQCFGPKTKVRPDLAGELEIAYHLVIDPYRVGNHHIFRLSELHAQLIVTDTIRYALEEANVTGIVFQPIPTDCDEPGRLFYWDDDLRKNVDWTHEERLAFLRSQENKVQ